MYQMKKGGSSKTSKQQAATAISMKKAGKKPKMKIGGTNEGKPVIKGIGSAAAKMGRDDMMDKSIRAKASNIAETASKYASKQAQDAVNTIQNKQRLQELNKVYKKGGSVGKSKMKMGGSCGTPKSLSKKK